MASSIKSFPQAISMVPTILEESKHTAGYDEPPDFRGFKAVNQ
jgi:hypothetical protein